MYGFVESRDKVMIDSVLERPTGTYADKGNLKEAEQLQVQALDMRKKLLGEEHPDTLISMANLASTYS